MRKALEDERNKNKTHVRNKFGSSSRRSCTAKGISPTLTDRAQEKDGFDGDAEKAKTSGAVAPVDTTGEGDKVMTDAEDDAHNARPGTTYTKADAREIVLYPCNRAAIPEGWETWFRLHLPTGDRKVYEWIVGNKIENCILYHYDNGSRGKDVIKELIKGRKIKAIHTDGYNAYIFLEGLGIVHVACTAHIWRYIMDWYNATESEDAKMLLTLMAALYTMETEIRGKSPE